MLKAIEGLLVLQDRDRRLSSLLQQLEKLPADEARVKGRLSSDQQAVDAAKEELQKTEVQTQKLELDVGTRRTTIDRLRQQQFETRKNDEYSALGHEIDRYGKEIDKIETEQLELMEVADGLRTKLEEARAVLDKSKSVVAEDLDSIAKRGKQLEQEVAETRELREKAAQEIDEELLSLYDRLLKKKNGVAISQVQNGQCGGCHVKLIPATLIKVNGENEVTQCENCGRILYPE